MNEHDIEEILKAHSSGDLSTGDATERLKNLSYENIGYARVDHARAVRQGFPEVIFGQGKTKEQIVGIFEKLVARSRNVLITRTNGEVYGEIRNVLTDAEWVALRPAGFYTPPHACSGGRQQVRSLRRPESGGQFLGPLTISAIGLQIKGYAIGPTQDHVLVGIRRGWPSGFREKTEMPLHACRPQYINRCTLPGGSAQG